MPSSPLRQSASGTADSSGCTITFAAPPLTRVWTGSVMIPSSPITTAWTITVGGFPWGTMTGPGPYNVQALPGEQLKLVATSGVTSGDTYTASFIGSDDPRDAAMYVFPISPSGAASSGSPLASGGGPLVGSPVTVVPSSSTNTASIAFDVASASDVLILVVGSGAANELSGVTGCGATWSRVKYVAEGTATSAEMWIGTSPTKGAGTIVADFGASSDFSVTVLELSSITGTVGTAVTSTSTATSISASATGLAGGVVVAFASTQNNGATAVPEWSSQTTGAIPIILNTAAANESWPWLVLWPATSATTYTSAFTITSDSALIVAPLD